LHNEVDDEHDNEVLKQTKLNYQTNTFIFIAQLFSEKKLSEFSIMRVNLEYVYIKVMYGEKLEANTEELLSEIDEGN
jgi:hypothetical protein